MRPSHWALVEKSRVWARSSEDHPKLSWMKQSLLSHYRVSREVEAWKRKCGVVWAPKAEAKVSNYVMTTVVVPVPGTRPLQSIYVRLVVSSKYLMLSPSFPRNPQDVYKQPWLLIQWRSSCSTYSSQGLWEDDGFETDFCNCQGSLAEAKASFTAFIDSRNCRNNRSRLQSDPF